MSKSHWEKAANDPYRPDDPISAPELSDADLDLDEHAKTIGEAMMENPADAPPPRGSEGSEFDDSNSIDARQKRQESHDEKFSLDEETREEAREQNISIGELRQNRHDAKKNGEAVDEADEAVAPPEKPADDDASSGRELKTIIELMTVLVADVGDMKTALAEMAESSQEYHG